MQTHGALRSEEASQAAWSGGRGAVAGAAKVCRSLGPNQIDIDNRSGGYSELY